MIFLFPLLAVLNPFFDIALTTLVIGSALIMCGQGPKMIIQIFIHFPPQ